MENNEFSFCALYLIKDSSPTVETASNGFEDCSVRVLHSNIPDELEPRLRPYMVNRISSGSCVPGASSVFNQSLGDCVIPFGDLAVYAMTYRHDNNSLLTIVMLHERDVLLAFQNEIDAFCHKKHKQLMHFEDHDVLATCREELNRWFHPCVQYLPRAVKILGDSLKYFLFASLCDSTVSFYEESDASWSQIQSDVTRFGDLTKLSLNLHTGPQEMQCILRFDSIQKQFTCSVTDSTVFTSDWAQVIHKMVGVSAPVSLKDLVVSFKQRALKDLNTFVRLVHLAENDHYALFRCVDFARSTNNEMMLLLLAQRQYLALPKSTESLKVIKVLKGHICGKQVPDETLIELSNYTNDDPSL